MGDIPHQLFFKVLQDLSLEKVHDDSGHDDEDEGDKGKRIDNLVLRGNLMLHGPVKGIDIFNVQSLEGSNYILHLPHNMCVGRIRVLFVCHGNICRSPMAEFIFKDILREKGLTDRFIVQSAATSGEHIGDPPDRRAAATLANHGISCSGKRSNRLLRSDFLDYDYIVGMDRRNMEFIHWTCPADYVCEIGMLREYAEGGEVDDPYYTGDFEKSFRDIERGCRALLDHILEKAGVQ